MGSIRDRANISTRGHEEKAGDYYDLKKKAVDDLINADESNSPEVSEEEINRYRGRGRRLHVSTVVKILIVKFWFAAALCWFFIWGLGNYMSSMIDLLAVTAIAHGVMTDILTNNAIRFFAEEKGSNDGWMMFPVRSFGTLFFNIIYAGVVIFLVYTIYNVINVAAISFTGEPDKIFLGVEPILFGVFVTCVDLVLISIKKLFFRIIADAKKKAGPRR